MMRAREAGFTLMEILVVLAVIALLAGALSVGYQRLPGTALKREAVKMAGLLRTAYDRATASGAHHRVVINLAEGTYNIERCEGKVQVRKVRDLQEEVERQRTEAERSARLAGTQDPSALLDAIVADAGQKVGGSGGGAGAACTPVNGPMGKKQKLGGRPQVSFSKIHVAHLEEPAVDGEVSINFFPLGTAERAVIVLGVGEEDHFSIAVRPLSGRIDMHAGEWRDVEAAVREDAEGDQI
jgi:prepilin-type N-terminal cleavage/methylation domain-containing protein